MIFSLPIDFSFAQAGLEFPPIRDIVPPVEPPPVPLPVWIWWTGAGVLGVVLLIGFWLWMRSVGRRLELPGLPAGPEKTATRALEALRKSAPGMAADAFAAALSEIVRTFLHRQTGVLARYSTSPEILGDRRRDDRPPPLPSIEAFREVLTASDALKYGPAVADRKVQTDALIDTALSAVRAACRPLPPAAPILPPAFVAGPAIPAEPPSPAVPPPAFPPADPKAEEPG